MPVFLCSACGTSFPPRDTPPPACPICDDERQYVPAAGQAWTTREAIAASHSNAWRLHEPGLYSLHTFPAFAINQRAFLLQTPSGNILWDCIALLDDATKAIVQALGGLSAIAISHPHYYTTMQDWSDAFGGVPIYLHEGDREWIMRPSKTIEAWSGDTREVLPGVKLIRLGGHFPGGTVLHWSQASDGAEMILSGDIIQVAADVRRVSFLWSYPNMMPLSAREVLRIGAILEEVNYERLYGAFAGKDIKSGAKAAVTRSIRRYVELLA
ncbi:MBL fold metallo-hydrolase [Microvirga rosea]|uniref:MBL fold metallo-hydrolase n=1 Tax=Microvirga rosea TaxID=2715425 RepID=UPI001D0B7632|nr:MBL fold metallo-hydrolase [Microvirga rosea]MCB8819567.1 MBL fold metallo-hydrolase [Microvirga rosea]